MINKLKDFFTKNIVLKFLAVVAAIFIWFIVMNVEDYNISKAINDIPVRMQNGNTILDNGMVYDITGGETISITVSGPRSVVENLTASYFVATADLSHLSVTNSTTISVVQSTKTLNGIFYMITLSGIVGNIVPGIIMSFDNYTGKRKEKILEELYEMRAKRQAEWDAEHKAEGGANA